jgi:outer membrane lipoprotein-sorting protein
MTSAQPATRNRWRRRAAWLVPVGVVAAVGVGTVVATSGASGAVPDLTPRTPAQLLTAVGTRASTALSGKVTETANLGLPELPGDSSDASLSWQSFITGSHSVRVWVDGPRRQRLAVIGELSEADVVHNGRDLWTYTSDTNTVSHTVLPAGAQRHELPDHAALTPAAIASRVLRAIGPSTSVSLGTNRFVAGQSAYTLDIAPRDHRSTIRKIEVAIDSTHFVPLQVEVFGDSSSPAVKVGFTDISFARPAAGVFAFHAPAGATVTKNAFGADRHYAGGAPPGPSRTALHPRVLGSGWTSVLELHGAGNLPALGGLLDRLTSAPGSSGMRLLHTALINAVLMPDGRVFVGAVRPTALEHVAATTAG